MEKIMNFQFSILNLIHNSKLKIKNSRFMFVALAKRGVC